MSANVIAIDGPAASGKSSVANKLAIRLRIPYVSTGSMYRAVTYNVLMAGLDPASVNEGEIASLLETMELHYREAGDGSLALFLNGKDVEPFLRSPEVSSNVSAVSAMPVVRRWLIDKQRQLAELGMIVMEGRDIGTVVFPDAKHKFFLTASPEVRARRRLVQGGEAPEGATVQAVAHEIAERDRQDMGRKIAPLRKADDAILVDSSDLALDEVVDVIARQVK